MCVELCGDTCVCVLSCVLCIFPAVIYTLEFVLISLVDWRKCYTTLQQFCRGEGCPKSDFC